MPALKAWKEFCMFSTELVKNSADGSVLGKEWLQFSAPSHKDVWLRIWLEFHEVKATKEKSQKRSELSRTKVRDLRASVTVELRDLGLKRCGIKILNK